MLQTIRLCVKGIVLIVAIYLAGCARLPEYGRPRVSDSPEQWGAVGEVFRYRSLTVADFQARSLPDPPAEHGHHIQARSCISLRAADNTTARVSRGEIEGNDVFIGRFSRMSFEAVFNPVCSWWNPEIQPDRIGYVLQHEQVHFALTEITARRLNRERMDDILQFMAIGATPEAIDTQLQDKLTKVSRDAMERDIAVHTAFDEATSLYLDPAAQQKWYDQVMTQLNRLKSPARKKTADKTKSVLSQGSTGG